jgi:hypothetical protein
MRKSPQEEDRKDGDSSGAALGISLQFHDGASSFSELCPRFNAVAPPSGIHAADAPAVEPETGEWEAKSR